MIIGVVGELRYWWVLAIAGLGGILGVLFTIPLRRALIIDQPLQFPEGVATAEVLKVGATRAAGVRRSAIAAARCALQGRLGGLRLWPETFAVARYLRRPHHRLLRHQPVTRAARRRLHRRLQRRRPDTLGGALSRWIVLPDRQHVRHRPASASSRRLLGRRAADARRPHLHRQAATSASAACSSAASGRCNKLRKSLCRHPTGLTAEARGRRPTSRAPSATCR